MLKYSELSKTLRTNAKKTELYRKKGVKMNYYRKIAIAAGVLFIIATVANILSLPFLAPMTATNYLVSVSANEDQVTTGALLLFIGAAAAVAGVAGVAHRVVPGAP
jgi:type IV secretory pathway component VirB8